MQPINFDLGSSLLQNPAGSPVNGSVAPGTYVSADLKNDCRRGVKLVIDITANAGAFTFLVTIQGKDPISGKYYTILASASLTAQGTTTLTVYPGEATQAGVSQSDILPATWRVSVAIGTSNVTATIGGSLIL